MRPILLWITIALLPSLIVAAWMIWRAGPFDAADRNEDLTRSH